MATNEDPLAEPTKAELIADANEKLAEAQAAFRRYTEAANTALKAGATFTEMSEARRGRDSE